MRDFLKRNAVSGKYMLKWGLIYLVLIMVGYLAGTVVKSEPIRAVTLGGLIALHVILWTGTFFIATYTLECVPRGDDRP